MTPDQLRQHEIAPILIKMNMWSPEAENLLVGTAVHESDGLKRITQYSGPALSYFQMEPATLHDLHVNWLNMRREKLKLLNSFKIDALSDEDNLKMNLPYAIAATRFQYYRVPEAIPKSLEGQAQYWKKYWNTIQGAGTPEQYINHNKNFYKGT